MDKRSFESGHPISKVKKTIGQKCADFASKWIGSWVFIILFIIFMIIWVGVNTAWIFNINHWDPRPFILLNLVLAFFTALQTPIILMSQNRQESIDRIRTDYDYKIDRKSAREIEEIKKQLDRIERKLK